VPATTARPVDSLTHTTSPIRISAAIFFQFWFSISRLNILLLVSTAFETHRDEQISLLPVLHPRPVLSNALLALSFFYLIFSSCARTSQRSFTRRISTARTNTLSLTDPSSLHQCPVRRSCYSSLFCFFFLMLHCVESFSMSFFRRSAIYTLLTYAVSVFHGHTLRSVREVRNTIVPLSPLTVLLYAIISLD